jgi:hypothetical protein
MKRILFLLVALLATITFAQAQDPPANQSAVKRDSAPRRVAYRLDFKLYELEDGKRTNQREYSLIASPAPNRYGSDSRIRIGTRVPVTTAEKQISYMDVGLSLSCRLSLEDDRLWGNFDIGITGFALPEQNADPRSGGNPILRNTQQNVESTLTPGKPLVLGTIDDLSSKKRMQIEVIATRLD